MVSLAGGALLLTRYKRLRGKKSAEQFGQRTGKAALPEPTVYIAEPDPDRAPPRGWSAEKTGNFPALDRSSVLKHNLPAHLPKLDILLAQLQQ
jgi:hypothetical protein